ncbi:SpaH/EbpB family LPXTG-anchored major pilin [Corynebacterium sp. CCM 9185]|uniref:SpaH/EbpB family LPXTG-anchored major pilin n=1 Tax=Corynebacterium marambiense TaxID=2765364 RepID=A0ABS0VVK1_9CORY|nr:SpaH/EbpB family LPXTG-anchored major pilin [Corynebacterium marambiense]MBI8999645.1 SpaH/EbpB family LPXTG-anchored major pilin [Corynebacterium marambiense]MCK7662483.1 SpaH/EbpB family LPXTG-anchored major pilin [Corynebacterium marambiense]
MTHTHDLKRRAATVALIGALLSVAVSPLATAEVVTGNVGKLSIAAIQADRTVRLVLHKNAGNPFDEVPEDTPPPGGVAGATFTVDRLGGYDLKDQSVWDSFPALTVEDTLSAPVIEEYTAVTNSDGDAVFETLPQGLYRVRETPPPDPSKDFKVSAPFLIVLPLADVDGTTWSYDVRVVPKNKPTVIPPGSTGSSDGIIIPMPIPIPIPGGSGSSSPAPTVKESTVPESPQVPTPDPEKGPTKGIARYLPETGANVVSLSVIGLCLVLLGMFLVRRRRSD